MNYNKNFKYSIIEFLLLSYRAITILTTGYNPTPFFSYLFTYLLFLLLSSYNLKHFLIVIDVTLFLRRKQVNKLKELKNNHFIAIKFK